MRMLERPSTTPTSAAVGPPILLVEDDRGHARLVERVLRKAGVADPLQVFHQGDQALAYLLEGRATGGGDGVAIPALILLDLHIPGKSGLELLTWIRGQAPLDRVPVVMLSGSSESILPMDRAGSDD